jgi:large subunit ribosomal protein L22
MEITAKTRMIRISPRKVRLIVDLIKKKNINDASGMLMYMPQKASAILKKLLDSAVANAKQKKYVDIDNLYIKNVLVDGGPTMKRFLPRAMGRATKIRKRTSHITMVLDES